MFTLFQLSHSGVFHSNEFDYVDTKNNKSTEQDTRELRTCFEHMSGKQLVKH